jgi:hypothetical protein
MERFPCTKLISTSRDRLAQPQLIIAETVSTAIDKSQNVVASSRLLIHNTEIFHEYEHGIGLRPM